jgi:putative pyruvate formate lyase activating enzyme
VDRHANQFGVCKVGRHARVASAFPHFGEEDVLRGWSGSGTIFFSWCNLRCVFCQNFETSQLGEGEELDARGLARLMLSLQKQGCHNINFVTPEHVAPQIVEALPHAIAMGLHLPLVYNTSAYDSLEGLQNLDGLVDIYMPDFKLWDEEASRQYLSAVKYPQVARDVIAEMHRQVGELKTDEDGLALRGVLVRHLVMPGRLNDTRQIVAWLATVSRDTYLNLMDQYYPAWKAKTNPRFAAINRRVTDPEMAQANDLARAAGLWRLDDRWRDLCRSWDALAVMERP